MGNLSNQFISKSYQSLIHLETDNTASSTLVGLQDGLGNSIGISVNTSGSLSISGSFTASLANGYAWVGDGNNRTSLVPTSSFGSVTSAITGSSLITASFSGNTLTFTKGNNTTFGVVIPDVSGSGPTDISALNAFTASQYTINTAIGASTSSLNSFTSSQDTKNSTLATYTGSVNTKFTTIGTQSGSWDNTALNSFTQSQDTKNSTLSSVTASLNTSASLAVYTASFSGNTLTFTKGNSSTFSVVLPDVSGSDISSLNAFTQSQETKNSTLASYTASVDTKFSTIGTQSGSWDNTALNSFTQSVDSKFVAVGSSTASLNSFTSSQETKNSTLGVYTASVDQKFSNIGSQSGSWDNTNINAFTQSVDTKFTAVGSSTASLNSFTSSQETKNSTLATYTGSNDTKWSNLGSQSGSFVTESETGSFARTNVDNNFSVNQTFTTITAVSASFTYLQTTFETSSVIYSSGSNQFGDELSDIQTLSGSVKIQGNLTINGTPVQTSSVDISALNAFTQSQETKNSTLGSYTASVDTKFVAVGSSTASLNSYTSSQDTKNSTLGIYTASVDTKFSTIGTQSGSWDNTALNQFTQSQDTKNSTLATYTGSNDTKWNTLGGQTGSYVTSGITGSSLITASVSLNTITFTKGDASTFNVTVNTGSAVTTDISSLNSFTQSQETKNSTLATYTASVDTKFSTIGTQSGSWDNTSLNSFTQSVDTKFVAVGSSTSSLNAYTQSNDTKWSNLASQSGSWVTSAITGSSLITASFSGNTLTFTKGDTTTFGIVIPDASGSVIPAGTISGSTQIIELGFQTTASFNAYTQSNDSKVNNLINATGSYAISSSVAAVDAAQQLQINSLIAATGSYITASVDITSLNQFTQSQESKNTTLASVTSSLNSATASLFTSASLGLTTASFSGNTLTFTKGNNTTFAIVIPDASGSVIPAGTISGSSQVDYPFISNIPAGIISSSQQLPSGLVSGSSQLTASYDLRYELSGALQPLPSGLVSGSTQIVELGFQTTASFNSYTQSNDNKVNSLINSTGSYATTSSLTSLSASIATTDLGQNNRLNSIEAVTGSYVTSAITGSSLVTASFSGNTLTFTKGDSSTFGVVIPDVSGSTIPAGTISGSAQITALGFVSSSVTGSSLITGSVAGNILTFTKGDATQFSLTVATGSGGGGTIDTGSFATTGSNTFIGNQTITGSVNLSGGNRLSIKRSTTGANNILRLGPDDNENNFQFIVTGSDTNPGQPVWGINVQGGTWGNAFDAGVRFNSYVTASEGLYVATGSSSGFNAPLQNGFTFVGDANGRTTTVATSSFGGSTDTGSLMVTGSVNVNVLTFTKGDGSTFDLTVAASGSSPAGTVSSSQQIRDYNIFAVKSGSNDFIGTQNFTGSAGNANIVNLIGSSKMTLGGTTMPYNETTFFSMVGGDGVNQGGGLQFQVSNGGAGFVCGDAPSGSTQSTGSTQISFENKTRSGSISFTNEGNTGQIRFKNYTGSIELQAGSSISISGSSTLIQDFTYPTVDGTNGQVLTTNGSKVLTFTTAGALNTGSLMTTGSVSGNVLTFTKGDATTFTLTVATGSGGGSTFSNPSVESISGSLLLTANTFTSGSANLLHLTASAQNQANLVFKNNNSTGTTIISGSSNIYTNPATPTTGYTRYVGGSNNLYLNATNGINSQITQSAASVSGARPVMNNNIFAGTGNFSINQAPNTGTHTYSQNIIGGTSNTTINALGFTGSLGFNNNISSNGTITINAASASVAQIATGISGSGAVDVNQNYIANGTLTITTPRVAGFSGQSNNNNILAGATITVTNISSSAAVNTNNNITNGTISYTNAAASAIHTSTGIITACQGAITVNANGSAVSISNGVFIGGPTITNNSFTGSAGVGLMSANRNLFQGQSHLLLVTGSTETSTGANFSDNAILGRSVTIFSNQTGAGNYRDLNGIVIGGQNLIVTASNSFALTEGGGAHFGRFNANDGRRNKTGEMVFSVGTGNTTTRKTGFLIDSGSNTFVEGSLNVSGSTAFTGSITATGNAIITGSVSITQTLKLTPQDPLPAAVVGELAVSGSSLYFYNGAWTLVI